MMKNTRTLPSIHIPVQDANGSVGWAWYMFFQWVSENVGNVDLSDYFTKEETEELLSAKANIDDLSDVAFSGDYDDLSNKPTIPDAQIQSDWNQADNTKVDYIKNKPTIPTVNNPTITISQGGVTKGSFTLNQASGDTIDLDAGGGGSYHPDLLDWKWADHICNDVQWLRADNFSWQSGSVYEAAYNHLVDDLGIVINFYCWEEHDSSALYYVTKSSPTAGDSVYNSLREIVGTVTSVSGNYLYFNWTGGGSETLQRYSDADYIYISGATEHTETVAGTTITYYPADDGHKIVLADQESNVAAIYTATGVAWYYILDTVNQRFKLPRTQYGVTGLRDTVGNYVPESLPNITGNEDDVLSQNAGGAFRKGSGNYKVTASTTASSGAWFGGITFDASRSSSAYQNDAPVQQRATQQYLYFYVGEFTQSAVENTAGLNAELFNEKANVDMDNLTAAGKSLISGLGMPSSRFIDLTLGASTSTYTAPANGWFTCACTGTTGSTYFELVSGPLGSTASFTGGWGRAIIPVFKGQVVTVYYGGNNFTKQLFRFIYAEGVQ